MSRRGSGPAVRAPKAEYFIGALIAASIGLSTVGLSTAQAATFGHSRIVSALGQPLHLEIPVSQLTPQEVDSLRAAPAPAQAWRDAGMTPPVALDSMRLVLLDGYRPDVKIIQLRSDQAFDQPIVDILLDIRSASGQQRYQVSLLAHADRNAVQRAGGENARNPRIIDGRQVAVPAGGHATAGARIRVRPGDNMFALAQRNAVQGVTVYQLMIALQRANPRAFIEDNVNLVKAGSTLVMPDIDALTALSDREARRIFQQHAQAFARYRQRSGGAGVAALSAAEAAAQGEVMAEGAAPAANASVAPAPGGDRLRLSGATGPAATAGTADARSLADAGVSAQAGTGPASTDGSSGAGSGPTSGSGSPSSGNGSAFGSRPSSAGNGVASDGGSSLGANGSAPGGQAAGAGGVSGGPASVNLLASSGAIASDAVVDKAPDALSSDVTGTQFGALGSAAAGAGTAAGPDAGAAADDDDRAALRKGVDESRTRILELEDNVRHLNEALQKQGHVAAEAALEGARSVSEAIREAMGLGEPAQTGGDAQGAGPASAESGAEEAPGTGAAGQQGAGGSAAGTGGGAATPQDGGATPAAGNGVTAAAGNGTAPATGGGSPSAPGGVSPAAGGAPAVSGSGQPGAGVAGGAAGTAGPAGIAARAPGGGETAGQSTTSGKAGKEVSWLQENVFAVIGGGLALIVLLIVWLLRRAGAARRDAFESDSPITDSMVREKLREIDLDLDQPSPDTAGRR